MSYEDTPNDKPEITAKEAVAAIDMICHGLLKDILLPNSWQEHSESVAAMLALEPSIGAGDFLIQFNLTQTREELTDPNALKWVAIHGTYITDKGSVQVRFQGISQPSDDREIQDYPQFNGLGVIQLQLDDIDWSKVRPGYCEGQQ